MLEPSLMKKLGEIVGEGDLVATPEDLLLYSYDSSLKEFQPEAVVFPTTTEEVSQILALANAEGIAVTPRGAGTGLAGGSAPYQGGIALSLTRMNRILEVDSDNLIAKVEPGVVNAVLQARLAPMGLFFPPDPASMNACTIGGNVAVCAGGPRCLKYGVTRDYVLGMEAVLADGAVIHTGGQTVKNTTAYDLTRLFVGSEGTLGVITDITLKILPQPEAKRTGLAIFDEVEAASAAVGAIIGRGIVPATLEMLDNILIQCAEDFTHAGLPRDAGAILLIEVDGFQESLDRQMEVIKGICLECRARDFRIAKSAKESDALWLARRSVIGAIGRVRPAFILQDVTVPRTNLVPLVAKVVELARVHDIPIGVLAHAGDGNLHPLIMFDPRDEREVSCLSKIEPEIFETAVALGGTLTGEHGVGFAKRDYLGLEMKPREIAITRAIKKAFDPNGILNPGKITAD